MMRKEQAGCLLSISTNDEHPDIITKCTGLEPEKILIKGSPKVDSRGNIIEGSFNSENLWIYSIKKKNLDSGLYQDSVLKELLDIMDSRYLAFEEIFTKFQSKHISCYGYNYDFHHYFIFNKSLLNQIKKYEIDIEFDIYFLGDD